MSKKRLLIILGITLILAACAGANPSANTPNEEGKIAGLFAGLWDGFTAGIVCIVSLFGKDHNIYCVNNNGFGYDLGFLLGIIIPVLLPFMFRRE